MCDNVFEMCWDWYDYYPSFEQINPKGPQGGEYRVMRGGYYAVWGDICNTTYRGQVTVLGVIFPMLVFGFVLFAEDFII